MKTESYQRLKKHLTPHILYGDKIDLSNYLTAWSLNFWRIDTQEKYDDVISSDDVLEILDEIQKEKDSGEIQKEEHQVKKLEFGREVSEYAQGN